jgi:hypothetical protein
MSFDGEYPTVVPDRAWAAMRADGKRALLFQDRERVIAFELTPEQCRHLAGELAKLAAIPEPPKTSAG